MLCFFFWFFVFFLSQALLLRNECQAALHAHYRSRSCKFKMLKLWKHFIINIAPNNEFQQK